MPSQFIVRSSSGTSAEALNVFTFGDAPDVAAISNKLEAFYTAWGARCPFGINFILEPEYRLFIAATGVTTSVEPVPSADQFTVASSGSGSRCPDATCVVVRWRTGVYAGGKPIQGRTYLPYGSINNGEGGLNGTTMSAMNTAGAAMFAGTEPLRIWSRKNGTAPVVTSASTWNEYGVQRRRR